MEYLNAATRGPGSVLAAVGRDGDDTVFMPFGHLAEGSSFISDLLPPEGGGFAEPE